MEMKCVVCDKSIPRGQRFIGDRYKTIKFCCEECYKQYCEERKPKLKSKPKKQESVPGWKKLIEYINDIYPSNSINWPMYAKQIKLFMKEYELTCDEIRLIIKFAIEFDDYKLNPEYGIGQFIPKYIEPTRRFREKIANNRLVAETSTGEIPVWNIKRSNNARKFYGKVEDFDD